MTALGSYNDFNNNFIRDCIFISAVNSCTSLYSGLAVFSVLGFMAKELGVPVAEVGLKQYGDILNIRVVQVFKYAITLISTKRIKVQHFNLTPL